MPFPEDVNGEPIEEYIVRFDRELEAIDKNTQALAALDSREGLIPSILLRIEKQMAETFAYKGAGPTRAEGVTPKGLGHGESASPGGSDQILQRLIGAGGVPLSGKSPSASSPGERPVFKQDSGLVQKLLGPGEPVSPTASVGGSGGEWVQRVRSTLQAHVPQYGELTPQDTLTFASGVLANFANKMRQRTPEWKDFQSYITKGEIDPQTGAFYTQDAWNAGQKLQNLKGGGGGILGRASNRVGDVATGYAAGKYASSLVSQIANPMVNAQNLAYLTGYQDSGQGWFGIHPGAILAGMGQRTSEMGFGDNQNVSPNQAQGIYNNLFGLGWFGGSSTNAMRQGLADITHVNPVLGTDPQVASMMDQATRMGQSSITQFVDVMKQVPAAANAAHLSLSQVVSDASALGQYYKGIGGTAMSGYQAATSFNAVSGLPAGVFQQLLQNPMVQGQVFMQSGLMPWEQGNAGFGNQMGGIFNAMNLFSKSVNLPPGPPQRDSLGLTRQVSKTDRVASLMSHYFGIDQSTIKNMMRHQRGIITGTNLEQNTSDYLGAVQSGKINLNDPAWHTLVGQMQAARDWNGHKMFSAKQLHQIEDIGHGGRATSNQGVVDWMNENTATGGGKSPGDWQKRTSVMYARNHGGKAPTMAELAKLAVQSGEVPKSLTRTTGLARERADAIQKILSGHTQSANQGPQITIGLSGTAAKFFKLSSNTAQGKAKANAGGSSVNIPYGQGPSDAALTANPETSGVSSNPTWGSSAGQSPNWETP